ncbi:MAG: hypothetical protein CMH49_09610 [Myxococcales bacterium]|nr:hypothetical protein [Myxococcales bacterium]
MLDRLTHTTRFVGSLWVHALIYLCFSNTCLASPFELYGVGSKAPALGNTGSASASDYSAVYYNPAALLNSESSLGVGISYAFKDLQVKLSPQPTGYEIPDLGAASPAVPSSFELRKRGGQEQATHSFTLVSGLSSDLGTENLRVGFLLSLPVYHSIDSYPSRFADERERLFSNQISFSLLGGRIEHFVAQVATAYQLNDWLALGLGASVMPEAFTHNFIYMNDAARQDEVDLNIGLQTSTQWRLNAGLLVTPNEHFKLGMNYRDEQYMVIKGLNEVQVRGLQGSDSYPFEQSLYIITDYSPRQFTYAFQYINQQKTQSVNLDLVYTLWSDYLDAHGERVNFEDVWSPRLGYEYQIHTGQAARLGIQWTPSPIPEQSGRSNYVDNNRFVLSVGSGHEIKIQGKSLTLSWHFQFHGLINRGHQKALSNSYELCQSDTQSLCDEVDDSMINPSTQMPYPEAQGLQTGNPGFPGYAHGGLILQAGIEISWRF